MTNPPLALPRALCAPAPPPRLPLLLLLLLLLAPPPSARAQQPAISLSPSSAPQLRSIDLSHAGSDSFTVSLSAAHTLLVDLEDSSAPAAFVPNGRPFILLSAAVSPAPTLVFTDGTAADAGADSAEDYACSKETPCLKASTDKVDVDAHAFFTHDRRAAVRLTGTPGEDATVTVVVEVRNFDRAQKLKLPDHKEPLVLKPRLKASIRFAAVADDAPRCPGLVFPDPDAESAPLDAPLCLGNGACNDENNSCECKDDYAGRFCDTEVLEADGSLHLDEPEGDYFISQPFTANFKPPGNISMVSVPAFSRRVYRWTQTEDDSDVHIVAQVLSGFAPSEAQGKGISDTIVRMIVKAPGHNGNDFLKDGPQLPSEYDGKDKCAVVEHTSDEERKRPGFGFWCDNKEVKKGESLLIALEAFATGGEEKEPRDAIVNFIVSRCGGDLAECPKRYNPAGISIPIAVLPVCVATIGITAIAIGVMLWLDRQHGFTSSVDRLSQKELDRMYPTEKFRELPAEGARSEAGSQETDECLICLSRFEQDESVRRLHCEHIYHSECLDPWLTQNNASCPACRCNVRVQNLSDRRRLRKLITFCLWPVVWARRMRVRRSGPQAGMDVDVGSPQSPDLELGLARSASSEPSMSAEAGLEHNVRDVDLTDGSAPALAREEGSNSIAGPLEGN